LAKALGIDIGFHAVKVAVVDGGPKGARLIRYAEVAHDTPGPAPTGDAVVAALKRALTEVRGPRQAASFAMPAEACILREISVPFDADDQIARIIKFEFEPHLHQGAIEDVVLDYVRTGAARTGSRILCIAAQKTVLRERLALLAQAGVDPLHVDVDVAALFNVARQSGAIEAHPNCLVIDIGARTTKALAIRDGQLRVARSIRLGSKGPEKQVETQLLGDREAARRAIEAAAGVEALAQPVGGDGPSTLEIVNSVRDVEAAVARAVQDDFLSRVLRETQRTLPAAADDKPLTRVFLTGGGASHARARERIAAHFGIEVEDLPVLARLEHRLPPSEAAKVATSGAVAVGTALKVVGIDTGEIDLRQEEFRFARTFDRTKTAMAVGATLLFFGVFLLGLTTFLQFQAAQRDAGMLMKAMAKELDEEVFAAYQKAVPEPRKRPGASTEPAAYFRDTRKYVADIRSHLKNELGLATEVPPIRSCLESWSAVSAALAEVRPKIEYMLVKDEKYFQDRADVTVIVGDLPDGDRIAAALRKRSDVIETVEIGSPKGTKDGTKQEITFKIRLQEKTVDAPGGDQPDPAGAKEAAK
jgi:Tfp pilus assembly PilM family ATPase